MARKLRSEWPSERCDTYEVQPHRYLYTGGPGTESDPYAKDFKAWKASVPYKEGEVVWVESYGQPKRMLILHIIPNRDLYGEKRELYRGLLETQKGHWSKQWTDWHPGFIQRGYQKAGLAPEMPDENTKG